MNKALHLIKTAKQKFILFSIVGLGFIMLIAAGTLSRQRSILEDQKTINEFYSNVSRQMNLINNISSLSKEFERTNLNQDELNQLRLNFQTLVTQFSSDYFEFKKWIDENDVTHLSEISELHSRPEQVEQVNLFIKKARELLETKKPASRNTKRIVRYLIDSSRDGIGEAYYQASENLSVAQSSSLSSLNQMGILLVLICLIMVLMVWWFVFRPLYTTVLTQHEDLAEALLKARSASRSKTEFLANISHEIRTPMTAIVGYADIIRRDSISKDERDDAIKIINQNASHLLGLIDEILDISKIEAGKFDFVSTDISLSTLLNEVYSLIHVKADEKGIDLKFRNQGKIPETISTDPKRLKQILFNLLGNAIKFTDEGYVQLTVSYNPQTEGLYFHIRDTGKGIDEESQKKLFRPFEQGDTSGSRHHGGTGLGLVLSRGLARGMGGDVKIEYSKVSVGTIMEFHLSVSDTDNLKLVNEFSTSVSAPEVVETGSEKLKKTQILVVDDAKENARLFKLYLEDDGAEVELATGGVEAIEKAKSMPFDIILLDLQMPGMDGFEVLKVLKESSYKSPIIALTAHAMDEEKENTKVAGFNGHITKPVKADVLSKAVDSFIKEPNDFRTF